MANPDPSLTPEKRLLDLIEEPEANKKEIAAGAQKARQAGQFSAAALKEKFLGDATATFKKVKASFGIKEINRFLQVAVAVLAFVFLVMVLIDMLSLKQDPIGPIEVPDSQALEMAPVADAAKGAVPVENWDLGKMFVPYGKRVEAAQKLQKEQSARLLDMAKNLKLTGISLNPKDSQRAFCMIEDVEKGITTFLREGDPLGLLRVSKIQEDRVILSMGDETLEIH